MTHHREVPYWILISCIAVALAGKWPCSRDQAIESFKRKHAAEPWPRFDEDPYQNQTEESRAAIAQYLQDRTMVCALQYTDQKKTTYRLRTFPNKESADISNYT